LVACRFEEGATFWAPYVQCKITAPKDFICETGLLKPLTEPLLELTKWPLAPYE
jgi:hypothetical protein